MHPDIRHMIMVDHAAELRREAAKARRASKVRRQLRNPLGRVFGD